MLTSWGIQYFHSYLQVRNIIVKCLAVESGEAAHLIAARKQREAGSKEGEIGPKKTC